MERGRGVAAAPAVGGARPAEGTRPLLAPALVLGKPGIASGVALAGLAGMALAGGGLPDPRDAAACLGGIVLAASGAAFLNGILDEAQDARMGRVARRAEALRRVGRKRAGLWAGTLIAGGVGLHLVRFGFPAALLVVAAVLSYVVLYTLVWKRRSPYGTIPGGIPGALPVLVGFVAVSGGRLGAGGVVLFLLMLLWQPPHFWALALRYREEYREAGLPVLPVARGEAYTRVLSALYAVALLPVSLSLWVLGFSSARFAAAAMLLWVACMALSWRGFRRRRYGQAFGASIVYITLLLLAVVVDAAFPPAG